MKVYFHPRSATADVPGGFTVSKSLELPSGDFSITDYRFGRVSLWFVDGDDFTADEREASWLAFVDHIGTRYIPLERASERS